MDSILLKNIELLTRIGVPDAERKTEQRVLVTVEIFHPVQDTATTDDVSMGIDYQLVTEGIVELAKVERKTIERLAEDVATSVLQNAKPKGGVKVTVTKTPPLPLESASIIIKRP